LAKEEDSFCPYSKVLENAVLPQKQNVLTALEALAKW
jgi:hypothetical protein